MSPNTLPIPPESGAIGMPPWGACAPTARHAMVLRLAAWRLLRGGGARRAMAAQLAAHPMPWLDAMLDGFPVRIAMRAHPSIPPAALPLARDIRPTRAFLRGAIPAAGGNAVLVGRNLLCLPAALARDRPAARVVTVAPDPVNHAIHRLNLSRAGMGRVESILSAIGHAGSVPWFDQDASPAGTAQTPEHIPSRPLLAILRSAGMTRLHALAVRCDGEEAGVLLPFIESAPRECLPDRIVIEVSCAPMWGMDLPARLAAAGFRQVAHRRGWVHLVLDPA